MEFEKFANSYNRFNIIQKEVIKRYLFLLDSKIVDLGCGSEGLCKYKKFDFYLGIDNSPSMLQLNPCSTKLLDFNKKECFEFIKTLEFNQIVSFSALQWARDLEFVFREIKSLKKDFLLAIFTSNTFKNLHNYLNISSPIYSLQEILKYSKILNAKKEILHYTLEFNTPKEMFEYIKFSGVRGGIKGNISKIKRFFKEFPFNTLEFEIVVISSLK